MAVVSLERESEKMGPWSGPGLRMRASNELQSLSGQFTYPGPGRDLVTSSARPVDGHHQTGWDGYVELLSTAKERVVEEVPTEDAEM